jgi:hypothetical protein
MHELSEFAGAVRQTLLLSEFHKSIFAEHISVPWNEKLKKSVPGSLEGKKGENIKYNTIQTYCIFHAVGTCEFKLFRPCFLLSPFPPFEMKRVAGQQVAGKKRARARCRGSIRRANHAQGSLFFRAQLFARGRAISSSKIRPLRAAGSQHLLTEYFRTVQTNVILFFKFLST